MRVLALLDRPSGPALVAQAIQIARDANACLTLACMPDRPSPFLAFVPVSVSDLRVELEHDAEILLRRLAASVPQDVPVVSIVLSGGWSSLVRELDRVRYDLVVMGHPKRVRRARRAVASWLGRLSIDVPVLMVPPPAATRRAGRLTRGRMVSYTWWARRAPSNQESPRR